MPLQRLQVSSSIISGHTSEFVSLVEGMLNKITDTTKAFTPAPTHRTSINRPTEVISAWRVKLQDSYSNFICTKKKSKYSGLADAELSYNNEVAKHRIIVENIFACLKRWRCWSNIIRPCWQMLKNFTTDFGQ